MMGVWTLRKRFRFEASHVLPHQGGKCARLHGHSWVAWVEVKGTALVPPPSPRQGMVMDYGDLSAVVSPVVERSLDHYHLNDSTGLDNPTSEELARWLYDTIRPALPLLVAVEIEETCTTACRYET